MSIPKYIQAVIGVVALVIVAYVGVLTWNAVETHSTIGRPPDVRDVITLSGEGKVTAKPDIAYLSLGIFSTGADVASTQKRNTEQMNAITSAMKAFDIKDEDLQTSNYSVSPEYDYRDGKQTLRGYRVSQNLSIKIRDLSKIGDILAKAGELGSNEIYGVTFNVDDPTELESQARDEAISDAKDKADALARQLGVRLGRIVSFSEDGYVPTAMRSDYSAYAKEQAMGVGGAPSPDIQSGSLDVVKNVSVTFEIK